MIATLVYMKVMQLSSLLDDRMNEDTIWTRARKISSFLINGESSNLSVVMSVSQREFLERFSLQLLTY